MNFLNQIKNKKKNLKPSKTTITHLDGRKFLVCNNIITEVQSVSHGGGFIIDTKPDKTPAKIIDNIFLGSQDCCDPVVIENFKITHVLSIGIEPYIKIENIVYKYVECLDLPETNLINVLNDSYEYLKNSSGIILVHCNAGVSRSAAVVIGYLILNYGYSYEDAFNIVKNSRNCIRPNDGFINQLKSLNSFSN